MREPITLGALIDALENIPEDATVKYNFPGAFPTTLNSYRGYYNQLALGHGGFDYNEPVTKELLLSRLEAAIGATFTGWKGGEFTMDRDTPVWCANPGDPSGYGITKVKSDGYYIILKVKRCDSW